MPDFGIGADTDSGVQNRSLLIGAADADRLDGGDASLRADAGDTQPGTVFDDTLNGGAGDDSLSGHIGADSLSGGDGADTLRGGDTAGGDVNDTVDGGAGNDVLLGGDGDDILIGGAGHDTVFGEGGDDLAMGGDGDDVIYLGLGDDTLNGGLGRDTLNLWTTPTSGVVVDLAAGTLSGAGLGNVQLIAIEDIFGGYYDDSVAGDSNANAIMGAHGADTLSGAAGDDLLEGHHGDDSLDGGDGFDVAIYSTSVTAGVRVDLSLTTAQAVLGGGFLGMDTLLNIEGLIGSVYGDTLSGNSGVNALAGAAGADSLSGGADDDRLFSAISLGGVMSASADLGTEQDTLTGGDGDDILVAGYGDNVDGGAGTDRLYLSLHGRLTSAVFDTGILAAGTFDVGGGTIQGVEQLEYLRGTNFADTLTLATQATLLTVEGGGGNDLIYASASAVHVLGGDGGDRFVSGSAADIFDGGLDTDTVLYTAATSGVLVNLATGVGGGGDQLINVERVTGSDYNDTLTGSDGLNDLNGGAGDDILTPAAGSDALDGGSGTDLAVFAGARANFWVQSIVVNGVISTWVIDTVGGQGSDFIVGVEGLRFNGLNFGLYGVQQNHKAVMDQDRFDDVLIRSASTGQIAFVDMIGQSTATQGVVRAATSALPAGWTAVASGDLSGFGNPQVEVIVQSPTGGLFYVDTISGFPEWGVISANLPSEWRVVGLGDMTLDGSLDIVIRSSVSGNIMYAEMNDTTFSGWGNVFNMGLGWRGVGVGDYDRDGDSDVLVQEIATGTTYYVRMQNGAFSGWGLVTGGPGGQWVAKEAADLNGDGYFDVVFQNSGTGQIWYVDMAGGVNSGWGTLVTAADWAVVGSGDYDNDGYADILVQSPANGNLFYIDVNNGVMAGWGNVRTGIGTDWVAV